MHYFYLAVAIVAEVIATSALKAADGFSHLIPSVIVVVGYTAAFYFLSLTLREMALGVVYAIWSGVGIALICMIGAVLYKQPLDLPGAAGISLIIAGVLVLNLFSRSVAA